MRVTPKASAHRLVPAEGAANDAVQKLLAKALGIGKTRLTLIQGATSRDKVFRIDGPLPQGLRE